jgi:hypothetical protein
VAKSKTLSPKLPQQRGMGWRCGLSGGVPA